MKVDLLDLKIQFDNSKEEILKSIEDVLSSGHYIMGTNVKKFEEEIASYTGVKHGIGVSNGTDALMLLLKAYGIGYGDEVITSPFTFFSSAETISIVGATPVFADIDKDTLCIDPKSIEKCISPKTKAIIPVHIFGHMCNMDAIMQIAKEYNLIVIEDACQAIGAEYKGKKAGSIGHAGCFSFFPTKNLGAYGDAGMIVTNDTDITNQLKLLRSHGSNKKYIHQIIGHNCRLDELQAAILRVKLKYIDKYNKLREEKAHTYNKLLSNLDIKLPSSQKDCKHVYHLYSIQTELKTELADYLKEIDIATGIYYPLPLHLQIPYKSLGYSVGDLPVAELACHQTVAIPLYPEITDLQQQYVADYIIEFYKNRSI